jgi:hypothetical protein
MRRLVIAVLTGLLALVGVAPAAADDGYVDLWVIVELDKVAYLPSEPVRMTVTVGNSGTAPATGVVVQSTGDLTFEPWGDLVDPGITLEPDGMRTVTVSATPDDTGADLTQEVTVSSAEPDQNPADNTGTVSAFVTAKLADLTLRLHADADGDRVIDPGETMSGVRIALNGGPGVGEVTGRTDEQGVIQFPGIAGGRYWVTASLPAGWFLDLGETIDVRAGQNDVVVRAWRVEISKLQATVSLDRATYAVGDTVRVRVTLTNTDDVDMSGVVAQCFRYTFEMTPQNDLTSMSWGDLAPDGAGATIRAGETRTWEFPDVVTQKMWEYGFVVARCQFVVLPMTVGAYAETRAAVPGGSGTMGGYLEYDGGPAGGVKLLLLDNGTVVARTRTDATGHFQFPALPANEYELRATGPWRLSTNLFMAQVFADRHNEYGRLELLASPNYDEALPAPKASPTKPDVAPVVVRPQALADTGADVVELLAFGLLLVVTGMVMVRRRSGNCV